MGAGNSSEQKPFPETDELVQAVRRGVEAIPPIIGDKSERINEVYCNDYPLLHVAVHENKEDVVNWLLDHGANINLESINDKKSALHQAVEEGLESIVNILLERGARVDMRDEKGNTAIHYAAKRGNKAIFQSLLDKGADIDAKNNEGRYALQLSIQAGREEITNLIFSHCNNADFERAVAREQQKW